MLECLLAEKPNLRIYLAAPTGKATSRMAQSIQESVASDRLVHLLPRMGAVLAGKSDAVVEAERFTSGSSRNRFRGTSLEDEPLALRRPRDRRSVHGGHSPGGAPL